MTQTLHLRSTDPTEGDCLVCGTKITADTPFTLRRNSHVTAHGYQACKPGRVTHLVTMNATLPAQCLCCREAVHPGDATTFDIQAHQALSPGFVACRRPVSQPKQKRSA